MSQPLFRQPLISIVMSVFNGGSFLSQAVESILNQSFDDFEFIIVDDGSSDGSSSKLDALQDRDARIRVIHQQNKGLIDALNLGCSLARGQYIARMDADDVSLHNRLASQVDFLQTHPRVVLVGGAVDFIDARGNPLLTVRYPSDHKAIQQALLDSSVFWHPTVVFSKDAFLAAGGYRNIPDAEDYDLWLRLAELGEVANLRQVLLHYRIHSQQVSVLRCHTQALGSLAAKASATSRRNGGRDLIDSMPEITADTLTAVGVSDRSMQTTVARSYLSSIRSMSLLDDHSSALSMIKILHSSGFESAEPWVIADSHLCAAKVYWSQAHYFKGLCSYAVAVLKRPVVLCRPFRTALQAMLDAFAL
jgi:GT2 family glycosyltransferase